MLQVLIPGRQAELRLDHLVLDFNGTIALDGRVLPGVSEKLIELSSRLKIYVLTADSNGSAASECSMLPVELHVIGKVDQHEEKRRFVQQMGPGVAVMGNGVNDELMFRAADLSIAVMGSEGCATATLLASQIVVHDVRDGLDLLRFEHRLIPTLRK